ncbi:hypothetical protein [Virgisporangium ochraceum]|nr:hypothetical protein [Virgisporangium ochraceum]
MSIRRFLIAVAALVALAGGAVVQADQPSTVQARGLSIQCGDCDWHT